MEAPNASNEASYAQQMADLRASLNGHEYTKHIKNMLPTLTPWQIRNAVNGRTENPLVLAAMRIVVHKAQEQHKADVENLRQIGQEAGVIA